MATEATEPSGGGPQGWQSGLCFWAHVMVPNHTQGETTGERAQGCPLPCPEPQQSPSKVTTSPQASSQPPGAASGPRAPPGPGTCVLLSWDHQPRGIAKPTCSLRTPREVKRSWGSKHRLEAWIHNPDQPPTSPRGFRPVVNLSVPRFPHLCNGESTADLYLLGRREHCIHLQHGLPLAPNTSWGFSPEVQPLLPGLLGPSLSLGESTKALGPHPTPQAQAHPLHGHQRAH